LWLIKVWFSALIPIAIGMVKFATFAKPGTVGGYTIGQPPKFEKDYEKHFS
jgi:hypothetical protein